MVGCGEVFGVAAAAQQERARPEKFSVCLFTHDFRFHNISRPERAWIVVDGSFQWNQKTLFRPPLECLNYILMTLYTERKSIFSMIYSFGFLTTSQQCFWGATWAHTAMMAAVTVPGKVRKLVKVMRVFSRAASLCIWVGADYDDDGDGDEDYASKWWRDVAWERVESWKKRERRKKSFSSTIAWIFFLKKEIWKTFSSFLLALTHRLTSFQLFSSS